MTSQAAPGVFIILSGVLYLVAGIYQLTQFRNFLARWSGLFFILVSFQLTCYFILFNDILPGHRRIIIVIQLMDYMLLVYTFAISIIHYCGRSAWINPFTLAVLGLPPLAVITLIGTGFDRIPQTLPLITNSFGVDMRIGQFPALGFESLFLAYALFVGFLCLFLLLSARTGLSDYYQRAHRIFAAVAIFVIIAGVIEIEGGVKVAGFSLLQGATALSAYPILFVLLVWKSASSLPTDVSLLKGAMQDGYAIVDAKGNIVDYNRAFEFLFDRGITIRLGKSLSDEFHALGLPSLAVLAGEGKVQPPTLVSLNKLRYEIRNYPVPREGGNDARTMVVFHNTSGKDELEEALQGNNIVLARRNALLTSLSLVSELAQDGGDPDTIIASVCTYFQGMGISSFIAVVAEDSTKLTVKAYHDGRKAKKNIEQWLGSKLIGWRLDPEFFKPLYTTFKADKPTYFTSNSDFRAWISGDPAWLPKLFEPELGFKKGDASILVPIVAGSNSLGILGLWGRTIDESDSGLFALHGRTLGWTLERDRMRTREARQVAELQRTTTTIAALGKVATRIQSLSDTSLAMSALDEELPPLGLSCAVVKINEGQETATIQYVSFRKDLLRKVEWLLGFSLVGYVVKRELWPGDKAVMKGLTVWYDDAKSVFLSIFPMIPEPVARHVFRMLRGKSQGSLCMLPLKVGNEVLGVMPIWGSDLDRRDEPALAIFGEQMAGLLSRNSILEREIHRASELAQTNSMLTSLSKVASCLESTPGLAEVYRVLGDELRKIDIFCMIGTIDEALSTMKIEHFCMPEDLSLVATRFGIRLPAELVIPRHLWPTDKAVIDKVPYWDHTPIESTARMFPFIPKGVLKQAFETIGIYQDGRICYLPMLVEDHVIGLLAVWGPTLRVEDLPTLSVFTNQVASAIKSAALLGQIQKELIERKQAEERLLEALGEKDILLREVHHRVKNNLQIISSLLKLQMGQMHDPAAISGFNDCQNRIRSMALIHEKLYQTKNMASVDFLVYLSGLVNHLVQSYRGNAENIRVDVGGDTINLDIDTAIPCGLIVNELVSNVSKYAFPDGRRGLLTVRIEAVHSEAIRIRVQDDGIGLPSGFDYRNADTLGFKLVSSLAKQIDGELEVGGNPGTACIVCFNYRQAALPQSGTVR